MTPMPDQLLTVEDLAIKLRLRPYTIRKKVRQGLLPAIMLGRIIRFDPEQVAKCLQKLSRRDG